MKTRNPLQHPRAGDAVAKIVTNANGVRNVISRRVLAVEHGTVVVYTRRRERCPCQCSLQDWRNWCKDAQVKDRA